MNRQSVGNSLKIWVLPLFRAAIIAQALIAGYVSPALSVPHVTPDKTSVCDLAAKKAAADQGVPLALMRAVAEVESGRGSGSGASSWPWTLNLAGEGRYFATRDAAASALQRALSEGRGNIDVGCFQLNHRWHGHHFQFADQMLDPWQNAEYAARFLRALYFEFGNWGDAAGAYHSRTRTAAEAYRARIVRAHARLTKPPRPVPKPELARRPNPFPLLASGAVGSTGKGSLVPVASDKPRRPLF